MAALNFSRIVQGVASFAAGAKSVTIPLSPAVDRSRCIVLYDVRCPSSRTGRVLMELKINAAGTQLTIERAGTNANPASVADVAYKLVVFSSGLTTHWITGNGSGIFNTPQNFGLTAPLNRSLLLFTHRIDQDGSQSQATTVGCEFTSSTQYTLRCSSSSIAASATNYTIQLVVFDSDAGVSVQHLSETLSGGTENILALPNSVVPGRSSLFATFSHGADASNQRSGACDLINSGASVRVQKNGSGTTGRIYLEVVQWPASVSVVTGEIGSVGTQAATTVGIPPVSNWSNAIPYTQGTVPLFGNKGRSTNPHTAWWTTEPGATTSSVACNRVASAVTFSPPARIQVLQFAGDAPPPPPPPPGDLAEVLETMSANSWRCPVLVGGTDNNNWSSALAPAAKRPSSGAPQSIFYAWPCSVIDTSRDQVVHYGGGHANYMGNEIYAADLATGLWQRISLPTAVTLWPNVTNYVGSPLGENDAPPAAHCYSSSVYLSVADRMYVHGGAAYNDGGRYRAMNGGPAGPYLYDLKKRDPNKVGGANGTGYAPGDQGLNAWFNAYSPGMTNNLGSNVSYISHQVTAYADVEGGKDVIYLYGGNSTIFLNKIVINNINDWSQQTITRLAGQSGVSVLGKAARVKSLHSFVSWRNRTGKDLTNALRLLDEQGVAHGKTSFYDISLSDPTGIVPGLLTHLRSFSLVWDEVRDRIVGCNGRQIIEITHSGVAPNGNNAAQVTAGWQIRLINGAFDPGYRVLRDASSVGPTHGKWHYYRRYDCFVYTESWSPSNAAVSSTPYVWLYKPAGWSPL